MAAFADLPHLTDADDVSLLTDVWMSTVTACVNWWLRHPGETVTEMSKRSRHVLTAFSATATDTDVT